MLDNIKSDLYDVTDYIDDNKIIIEGEFKGELLNKDYYVHTLLQEITYSLDHTMTKEKLYRQVLTYVEYLADINSKIYTGLPSFQPVDHYFYVYHNLRKLQRTAQNSQLITKLKDYLDNERYLTDEAKDFLHVEYQTESESESETESEDRDSIYDECLYDILGNEL